MAPLPHRPFVSAHRHGNTITLLEAARRSGADFVELDVHLFWRRLEVRHHKSVGPLPVLFDRGERWHVGRWPVRFEDIVDAAGADAVFHVDLKGWRPRLSRRVIDALGARPYLVSSRSWWLLRPFRGLPDVQVMRSIGARWQLRWFLARHRRGITDALCIRSDRLTPELAAHLRARAPMLFTWGVASASRVEELAAMGLDGFIVDDLALVPVVRSTRSVPA